MNDQNINPPTPQKPVGWRYVSIRLDNIIAFALILVLAAVVVGFMLNKRPWDLVENVVAMKWGDGKYGKAFYGAQVYLAPAPKGNSVRARVLIGAESYYHDCGELAVVGTKEEAVARFSDIEWSEGGVTFGKNGYFLPRARLESHR